MNFIRLSTEFSIYDWAIYNISRVYDILYMGWSDVTESMATTRTPFCGYNMAQCVKLMGEYLSCYLSKTFDPLVYGNVCMIINLPTRSILAISQWNIYQSFTHKMAAKTSWYWSYVTVTLCIQPRSRQINRRNTSHCKTTHMQCTVQRIGRVEKSHHFVGVTRMTSNLPGAAAYFMLLLCVKAIDTFLIMPTS